MKKTASSTPKKGTNGKPASALLEKPPSGGNPATTTDGKRGARVEHSDTRQEMFDTRSLLRVLRAVRKGDFSVRMPEDQTGSAGEIADILNDVIDLNDRMAKEFERVSRAVGRDGRINQRASIGAAAGSWEVCIESVNSMITDLVHPTTEVARVIGAVAKGDLSQTMALEVDGRPVPRRLRTQTSRTHPGRSIALEHPCWIHRVP